MSDLPQEGLFQQLNARPRSGEELETLGKQAALRWRSRGDETLTAAVVETVKQAQLSPEQVKRVVEFANTTAYLDEFRKEGATHKVIEFAGGPANFSDVLKDLNDGGGGSVFDRGTSDYNGPPLRKFAEADEVAADRVLREAFHVESPMEFHGDPLQPALDTYTKLAAAHERLTSELSGLEVMYHDLLDRLHYQTKIASLSGTSLGQVAHAWSVFAPSDVFLKVAFEEVLPRLMRDGVFSSVEEMNASAEKVASAGIVNERHALVTDFREFCDVLSSLSEKRAYREEVGACADTLQQFIKKVARSPQATLDAAKAVLGKAAPRAGLWNTAKDTARSVGRHVGDAAEWGTERLLGEGHAAAPHVGNLTQEAVAHLPHLALGVAGMEGLARLSSGQDPVSRGARGMASFLGRNIPMSPMRDQYKAELEYGYR